MDPILAIQHFRLVPPGPAAPKVSQTALNLVFLQARRPQTRYARRQPVPKLVQANTTASSQQLKEAPAGLPYLGRVARSGNSSLTSFSALSLWFDN